MNDPAVFQPWFSGRSWNSWKIILRAAFALPLTSRELKIFRGLAGGRDAPTKRVKELWIVAGRRSGKDSIASVIAAWVAAYSDFSGRLRPGERALVMCLANSKDQAKIALDYSRSYFTQVPMLRALVTQETAIGLKLSTGTEIAITTNNFRAPRGRPVAVAILDEVGTWRSAESTTPDFETFRALTPSMLTIPESMLIGISSPYRASGLLFERHKKYFGQNDDDVLVVQAASIDLNPTLDKAAIAKALEEDPESGAAEFLAKFRRDISGYVDRQAVETAVMQGVFEIPPSSSHHHFAFVDPAGGSGADSYTLAICRNSTESGVVEVVALRETKPPFSPEQVTADYADLLKAYGISEIRGDHFGGEFPRELFRKHSISFFVSGKPKSDLYKELLPALNSGKVRLLDNQRLVNQLCSLERRTARGGKDSIDHPPHAHDDCANAVAGAVLLALSQQSQPVQFVTPYISEGPSERNFDPTVGYYGDVLGPIRGITDPVW